VLKLKRKLNNLILKQDRRSPESLKNPQGDDLSAKYFESQRSKRYDQCLVFARIIFCIRFETMGKQLEKPNLLDKTF